MTHPGDSAGARARFAARRLLGDTTTRRSRRCPRWKLSSIAISHEARRKAFWPSIAVASAQLRSVRREREKPGDPAVARLSSPGAISVPATVRTCAMKILGRNCRARISSRSVLPCCCRCRWSHSTATPPGCPMPSDAGSGRSSRSTPDDGRNGIEAGGRAAETGSATQRSGRGTLKITRSRGTGLAGLGVVRSGSAGTQTGHGANGKGPGQMPRGGAPGSGGDTGSSGPSGDEGGSAPGTGSNSSTASTGSPSLSVTAAGEGTGTGVSAGGDGLTIGLGADSAGGDEPAGATVTVTDTGGAPSSLNVGGPDPGVSLP